MTSHGNLDVFLASYPDLGALRFAFALGSGNDDAGTGIVLDDQERPRGVGTYAGLVDFDPGPGEAEIGGTWNAFVAGYASAGAVQFA